MPKKKPVAKPKAKKKPVARLTPKKKGKTASKVAKLKFVKKVQRPEQPVAKERTEPEEARKNGKGFETLRGMKDLLPEKSPLWLLVYHTAENIAKAYGFGDMETPIL